MFIMVNNLTQMFMHEKKFCDDLIHTNQIAVEWMSEATKVNNFALYEPILNLDFQTLPSASNKTAVQH